MKGIVKIWRGTREAYDAINPKDFYTRYSVRDTNGVYSEYYGTHKITVETGQVAPVIDIISNLSEVSNVYYSGLSYEKVNIGNTLAIGVNGLTGNTASFNITKYENGAPLNDLVVNSHPLKVQWYQDSLLNGYYIHWWASQDDGYTPHMEENPSLVEKIDELIETLNKYYKDIDKLNLGDRYLDQNTFDVIEKTYYGLTRTPLKNNEVKVVNRDMATYQVLDGELMTYDRFVIDCGSY